jgi:hypothetical protein
MSTIPGTGFALGRSEDNYPLGFFNLHLTGLTPGDTARIEMHLPPGIIPLLASQQGKVAGLPWPRLALEGQSGIIISLAGV